MMDFRSMNKKQTKMYLHYLTLRMEKYLISIRDTGEPPKPRTIRRKEN